jgi:F-type H+-transporting ATPase subunit b
MLAASNPLVPNATFVVELVAFLAVLGVVARFILPPISRAMRSRQHEIETALDKGRQAERRLIAAEAEYRTQLQQGRRQARLFVERAQGQGEQLRRDARQKADEEYGRRVAMAQVEIERAVERARRKLRQDEIDAEELIAKEMT